MHESRRPAPQLLRLFEQVQQLPEQERARFMDDQCAGDASLRTALEDLLKRSGKQDSLLDKPIDVSSILCSDLEQVSIPGYEILHKLGEGGMGLVYAARRQHDDFCQDVAIKVSRRIVDTDRFKARFNREQRILAGLRHPNIATFVDAGSIHSGQPYMAMELIDGQPITAFCEDRQLSISERLKLFVEVCLAVQYAHSHLIVHRDLKPDNVLVNREGQVKLLDFGVAKMLDDSETGHSTTALITPEYASPEQLLGEPVSTESDIYSLGVLLYQLISGQKPYRLADRSIPEIMTIVCDTPVTPPSKTSVVAHQVHRQTRVSTISGDLDNIILKAMHRQPERRYASAARLAEDIQCYLQDRPVSARADSRWYRTSKFLKRHRLASGLTAVILGLVITSAILLAHQVGVTRAALEKAELERNSAIQANDFIIGLFRQNDPTVQQQRAVRIDDLLKTVTHQVIDNPAADAGRNFRIINSISRMYINLRLYQEARDLLHSAFDHRLSELADEIRVQVLMLKGVIDAGLGAYRSANDQLTQAHELAITTHGEHSLEVATIRFHLAESLFAMGQYDSANAFLDLVYPVQVDVLGEHHVSVIKTLSLQGRLARVMSQFDLANRLHLKQLAISRAILPEDHPSIGITLQNLGVVAHRLGQYGLAEQYNLDAYRHLLDSLGSDHPTVGVIANALGALYLDKGDYENADQYLTIAMEILSLADHSSPYLVGVFNNLGLINYRQKNYPQARDLFERAVEASLNIYEPDSPRHISTEDNLGLSVLALGHTQEAEAIFRNTLDIRLRLFGEQHDHTAYSYHHIAQALAARGQYQDALVAINKAIAIREQVYDSMHELVGKSRLEAARILISDQRCADAIEHLDAAQSIFSGSDGLTGDKLDEIRTLGEHCGHQGTDL